MDCSRHAINSLISKKITCKAFFFTCDESMFTKKCILVKRHETKRIKTFKHRLNFTKVSVFASWIKRKWSCLGTRGKCLKLSTKCGKTNADFILRVGEKSFPAHKVVLAVYSCYFNSMFSAGMKESSQAERPRIKRGVLTAAAKFHLLVFPSANRIQRFRCFGGS